MSSASSGPLYRLGGRQKKRKLDLQRGGVLDNYESAYVVQSLTVKELLKCWAWGEFSACQIQSIAHSALSDQKQLLLKIGGHSHNWEQHLEQDLVRMAGLGTSGKHKANCHRDLLEWLGKPQMPTPFTVHIDARLQKATPKAKAKALARPVTMKVPMKFVLPHEMFAFIFTWFRPVFNSLFLGSDTGDDAVLKSWWMGVSERRDPRIQHHPMLRKPGWEKKGVPIAIHGDGVPCIRVGRAGTKSLDAYSWHGLMGSQSTLFVKHYIISVFTASMTEKTMDQVWMVISWSLHWLFQGVWPDRDHHGVMYDKNTAPGLIAGTQLAGGYFGVPWMVKGDLKFFSDCLGMRNCNSNQPCDFCPCHRLLTKHSHTETGDEGQSM